MTNTQAWITLGSGAESRSGPLSCLPAVPPVPVPLQGFGNSELWPRGRGHDPDGVGVGRPEPAAGGSRASGRLIF